jgi:putative heme iron utilization protein
VTLSADPATGRALLERERHAVLSTAHEAFGGWPFGSVVPFATTPEGDPVLLLSDLAEHTKNLAADPRASLFVADPEARERPQAGARLTLLARAEASSFQATRAAMDLYVSRFPEAREHLTAHAFAVHVLRVERVRWIAGFGSMGWWTRAEWARLGDDPLAPHADAIRTHMNADHAGALVKLARGHGAPDAERAVLVDVEARGLGIDAWRPGRANPVRVRVRFPGPVASPDAARRAVIGLLAETGRSIL